MDFNPWHRQVAAGIARATRHGIARTGCCRVSGRHLQASNEPDAGSPGLQQVIQHARIALEARGRGDHTTFRTHADKARQLADRLEGGAA